MGCEERSSRGLINQSERVKKWTEQYHGLRLGKSERRHLLIPTPMLASENLPYPARFSRGHPIARRSDSASGRPPGEEKRNFPRLSTYE
jgi:hypothetical protein